MSTSQPLSLNDFDVSADRGFLPGFSKPKRLYFPLRIRAKYKASI
jgi:hypothetical protein